MAHFIREFEGAISGTLCTGLIAKFDHYESHPGDNLRVLDKFLSDGGESGRERTKEAKVIYLRPSTLRAEDPDLLGMVGACVEAMNRSIVGYVQSLGRINIAPIEVQEVDLMRYDAGEGFYGAHVDAGSRALQHRVLSLVMYLNDVEEGGETEFPLQDRRVRPETGKLVVFPSNFSYVHRSTRTVSGPKYVLIAFSSFVA